MRELDAVEGTDSERAQRAAKGRAGVFRPKRLSEFSFLNDVIGGLNQVGRISCLHAIAQNVYLCHIIWRARIVTF